MLKEPSLVLYVSAEVYFFLGYDTVLLVCIFKKLTIANTS